VEPPTGFIRISGRAAAEGARDFKLLIQRLQGEGISSFCLDLTGCLLMDSTFSGVLAGLSDPVRPDSPCERRFTLVGANARILDLLDNLGVLPLVLILEKPVTATPETSAATVATGGHSKEYMATCCLEAHRLLMALKPENAAKFRAVTEILEQQLQAG
jgi:anti-anti-sigma regulatory factor